VFLKQNTTPTLEIVSVYPNPARDKVEVKLFSPARQKVLVNVTDITGKVVQQMQATIADGSGNFSMPVSALEKGVYFLKITDNNGIVSNVVKVVKE
jgi:hypothetical protein